MKPLMPVVAAFLSFFFAACSPIGGQCRNDGDCGGAAQCGTNYPGGYCFQDCTGNPDVCPNGSQCIRFTGARTAECYESCWSGSDCRPGYECMDVERSAAGVCLPR